MVYKVGLESYCNYFLIILEYKPIVKNEFEEPMLYRLFTALQPLFNNNFFQTPTEFCLPDHIMNANQSSERNVPSNVLSDHVPSEIESPDDAHQNSITKNIYSKPAMHILSSKEVEIPTCCCLPEDECGNSCQNRAMQFECSAEKCPCEEKCRNNCFQTNNCMPKPIEQFATQQKGLGVRATQRIEKNTFILEYVGEVITLREYEKRLKTIYKNDEHFYAMELEWQLLVDSRSHGNMSRYINHSCDPNCKVQKWTVNGHPRLGVFASREICHGEELSFDYNFAYFNSNNIQACKCDAKNCNKTIGGKMSMKITASKPSKHNRKRTLPMPIMPYDLKKYSIDRDVPNDTNHHADHEKTAIESESNEFQSHVKNLPKEKSLKILRMKQENGISPKKFHTLLSMDFSEKKTDQTTIGKSQEKKRLMKKKKKQTYKPITHLTADGIHA